ncbi:MAG: succinate dehydrogenase, cytochrome b556 subunit [Rhodospirillales bacterium]|nr:succinate dehydrogenase, cytochrome b556 subunit [Rhodospirillales bacterium]
MRDVREALMAGRTSDGKPVLRPLSPHLQVYRPQITSVLSIMHRGSGIWLGFGTILLVWWLVALAGGAGAFAAVQRFLGSWFGMLLLFLWTAALMFHFSNGMRHLAWDAGAGFEKPTYHASGWTVVAAAALLTVLLWVIGLALG